MALPVVIVSSGGLPMNRLSAHGGLPVTLAAQGLAVTEAPAGYGLPMTFVTEGGSVVLPVPPITNFATLNATPSAGVTMSNGNLTATHGAGGSNTGVHTLTGLTTGKFYFEITLTVFTTGTQSCIGLKRLPGIGGYSSAFISDGLGVQLGTSNNTLYSNGGNTSKQIGAPAAQGNVFGFAINLTNRLAWVRKNTGIWNNDAAANPATSTGGVAMFATGVFAPGVGFSAGTATDAFTANFGASVFVGAVPSGFSSGWGT